MPIYSYSNLQGANLGYANLQGANLGYANLQGANLGYANLEGVLLIYANLGGANLIFANLQGADLRYAKLQSAALADANLRGANLEHANLRGANLGHAELQSADLSEVNLQGADLWQGNLQGALLGHANLEGASLSLANLQGANLVMANLQGALLEYVKLQGADLRYANLQSAALADASFQGADLSFADLQGAILMNADLQGADLRGANLVAADLRGARLWRTVSPEEAPRWAYADLRGATVNRPSAEQIETLKKDVQEIRQPARNRVMEVLQTLEQDLDQDGTPAFPVAWRTKADILFDPDASYAKGWADPPPIEVFDEGLAVHLIGLACAKEAPPALARNIATRVRYEPESERPYRVEVARRIVDGQCPPAEGLPEEMVADLRKMIRSAPTREAPEGDMPVAGEQPEPADARESRAVAPAAGPVERTGKE